jgi:OmpA-OmpF porin, OOP family
MHGLKSCRWIARWSACLLLAGCATTGHHNATGQGDADKGHADEAVVFPDPAHSLMPEGSFVNLENLRNVSVGMTKQQLRDLLGAPHFNEGVIAVRQWNYIFDFRPHEGGSDTITCQYQVQFDKQYRASAIYWKPESCKSVLDEAEAAVAPPPPPQALPKEPLRLSSDALFEFDRADLTEAGRQQLSGLLQRISSASEVQDIQVVGYTDRIGSDGYNLELSRKRAQTVSDFLVAGGVAATVIHAEGRGKDNPLVQCQQKNLKPLIACLAPNRRVEVSGVSRG